MPMSGEPKIKEDVRYVLLYLYCKYKVLARDMQMANFRFNISAGLKRASLRRPAALRRRGEGVQTRHQGAGGREGTLS